VLLFADIALIGAIAVAALKLLDFFVGDARKKWLNEKTLQLWFWLAEAKNRSLLDWLRRYEKPIFWTASLLSVGSMSLLLLSLREADLADMGPRLYGALVALLFIVTGGVLSARAVIPWIFRGETLLRVMLRSLAMVAIAFLVTILPVVLIFNGPENLVAMAPSVSFMQVLFLIAVSFFVSWSSIVVLCALIVTLPTMFLYVVSLLLAISEFIARRVAESAKGPLLAMSTLIALVAGLFKLFQ
jgi:hypothetical protein